MDREIVFNPASIPVSDNILSVTRAAVRMGIRLLRAMPAILGLTVIAAGIPATTYAEAPRWENTLPALRLQVDSQRNRVWVLNVDAVYLYDIATRRLIRRIELPGWTMANDIAVCAPDLALTSSGSVLITSNVTPNLWEIDAQSLMVRERSIALDADTDKDIGFTGLALSRDGRDLYGVSALHGSAWRIELATDRARKLSLTEPIRGACGVAVLAKAAVKTAKATQTLCIAGNGPGRRVELAANGKEGRVMTASCTP